MKKNLVKIFLSFVMIVIAVYIVAQSNEIALLKRVSSLDFFIILLLSLLCLSVFGYIFSFITKKQHNTPLSLFDTLTLPFMMHLWGLIIPVKGGMLYLIFFLKSKYNIQMVKSASIAIYRYLISFVLIGIFGIYLMISRNQLFSIGTSVFIIIILSPIILKLLQKYALDIPVGNSKTLLKLKSIISSIIIQSNINFSNIETTSTVTFIILIQIILRTIRYYFIASVLDFNIPFMTLFALTWTIELANIFRFLPGNIGLNELFSGGVFSLLGADPAQGILIALLVRVSVLLLTFTIGLWAVLINMKYFQINTFKSLWSMLKTSEPNC
ncbi:MAG: flippase-like domain-containing protein [Candidatus Omnitrophica bacterium]|nr:flippase-like domain-containing protein [Candidatus Omnitrophota bacterium]